MKNNSILSQVPKEHKIKSELRKAIFGGKIFCPRCGSPQVKKHENRYRCKLCRKPFSLTSVSWLKGMKLPLTTFWLLLWCWTNKTPVDQAMRACGVSEPTARRWYGKFRSHLPQSKLDSVRLSGRIQMDEAYRGGKTKGYSIVGAKEKAEKGKERRMSLKVLLKPSVDRKDAIGFLSQAAVPGSELNTDGAAIYKGIGNWWPVSHEYEIHKKFEFALTSEIEGLWGNLFTFIRRMYHHVTKEKVESVVREFAARSMFPHWFKSPSDYISASFARIPRPKQKEWRGQYQIKKKVEENLPQKIYDSPFVLLPEVLSNVPY